MLYLCGFLPYLWGMETCNHCTVWKRIVGFYLTYEEWKHDFLISFLTTLSKFLPYLWGMETGWTSLIHLDQWRFLPYLWGMETLLGAGNYSWVISFYLTYEEWKHGKATGTLSGFTFLPYLWGMETSFLCQDVYKQW